MGFFDKVTKAVGDAVDKGKKDIDQFMRIQKINGEISAIEAKLSQLETQMQQNSHDAGQKAIELMRAERLSSPDLQVFVEKLADIERQIAAEQSAVLAKKADIERIKAEDAAAAPPPPPPEAATPMAPPPPLPATPPPDEVRTAPVVPPVPTAAGDCPQCGKPLTGGAFCIECGAKVG